MGGLERMPLRARPRRRSTPRQLSLLTALLRECHIPVPPADRRFTLGSTAFVAWRTT